jgi:hypothetical protein
VDPDFWFEAGRDLGLLVAGGALTIFGGWISNRHARKQARQDRANDLEDKKEERARAALESFREVLFEMYVSARDQVDAGEAGRIKFEQQKILDAEARGYLIPGEELRELARLGLGSLRGLGAAVEAGRLKGDPVQLQVSVLFALLQVTSAALRSDPLPESSIEGVRRIGTATRDVWEELIRTGQARPK